MAIDLSEYNDVASRIAEFRDKHPEGSLRLVDPSQPYRVLEAAGTTYLVVVTAAFRTPDDPAPGIGMAQEEIPGRTPYTKGSELQNAETSSWGRAIVAALAADTKKGVASADDVRNRRAEQEQPQVHTDPAWAYEIEQRIELAANVEQVRGIWSEVAGAHAANRCADPDRARFENLLTNRRAELQAVPA